MREKFEYIHFLLELLVGESMDILIDKKKSGPPHYYKNQTLLFPSILRCLSSVLEDYLIWFMYPGWVGCLQNVFEFDRCPHLP